MDETLLRTMRRRDRSRRIAAYGTTAVAALSLLSAVSRPTRARFELVLEVVPFLVTRSAATTLVFVVVAQVLAARGLRRGHRLAWVAAVALLACSAVLNLVKAVDVEESVIALLALAWLASQHAAFPVLPTPSVLRRTIAVALGASLAAVAAATALAVLLGRRHHPRFGESAAAVAERLGGRSALPLPGVGPHLSAVLAALGLAILVATLWVLLSPRLATLASRPEHLADRERARAVVARHGGDTLAYFALRDDKQWFFHGDSVVAYAVHGGVCLVSPDPIGPSAELAAVWAAFSDYTQHQGWSLSVVAAAPEQLPLYAASGMHAIYLGDEAILDSTTFTLDGRAKRSVRSAHSRVSRAGYSATFHDPASLEPDLVRALAPLVSQSRRGEAERGFSMTLSRLFDPADTGLHLSVARREDGEVGGFIQWVPAADIDGWSLDVMRRNTADDVPNGVMDFLIVETVRHLAEQGLHGLGLNFAVLRTVVSGESDGRAARVGRSVLHKVASQSQVESLWKFNAKYEPAWRPRYVVVDSVEFVLAQGLAVADAEGVSEIPLVGRFLGVS